jgi:hypothetical protein
MRAPARRLARKAARQGNQYPDQVLHLRFKYALAIAGVRTESGF